MARRRDVRRTNNSVMFGIMGLAIAVILIVVLFLAMCGGSYLPNFFG